MIFSQEREKTLKMVNNAKRIINVQKDAEDVDWFSNVVKAYDLFPLLKTNYGQVDHDLLTAFSERCHTEMSSFHLPIGEMTITLNDVSCLLHILVELLFHENLSIHEEFWLRAKVECEFR
jgi:hypothetical protein